MHEYLGIRCNLLYKKYSISDGKQSSIKIFLSKDKIVKGLYGLEYDHVNKYSHFGTTAVKNVQQLCRNCNQRKEVLARQTGFFA